VEATLKSPGPDTILGGGIKSYAPRYSSGRVDADATYLLPQQKALCVVQQVTNKDATGMEFIRQSLLVVDTDRIGAIEFAHWAPLKALGLPAPRIDNEQEYRPGALVG
ncbi:MAG: hypothetical protein ACRCZF_19895, partial [Gemmataceae bacterium]